MCESVSSSNIVLFDRTICGFVKDLATECCTYLVTDAQVFSSDFEYDANRYMPHSVAEMLTERPHHVSRLMVEMREFAIGTRANGRLPVVAPAEDIEFVFDLDDDYVLEKVETRWSYRFAYGDGSYSQEGWKLADSEAHAYELARANAVKVMTGRGDHRPHRYMAYAKALAESGAYVDDHEIKDKNENPMFNIKRPVNQIGDEFEFKTDGDKAYARKELLRFLIRKHRFSRKCFFGGYGHSYVKKGGKLSQEQKDNIKRAMAVFDNAYKIEVAGCTPQGGYGSFAACRAILGGVPGACSGFGYSYRLLFRAVVDGQELVLVPDMDF